MNYLNTKARKIKTNLIMQSGIIFNITILVLISTFSLSCLKEEPVSIDMTNRIIPNTSRIDKKGIKIAIGAMISPRETYIHYGELIAYISKIMKSETQIVQRKTYAETNKLLQNGKIDIAFVCSGPYIDGHDTFGLELLVAPVCYGKPQYYSYIIVPHESEIKTFKELRDKRFAFTDPDSNSGKRVPCYELAKRGETPTSFFKEFIYTYSHDNSIKAVAMKFVDGAAVDHLIWEYEHQTNPKYTSKTKVIEKIGPFGIPPIVVRPGMSREFKNKWRQVFLNLHKTDEGKNILSKLKIDKFIVVGDAHYNSVRQLKRWENRQ